MPTGKPQMLLSQNWYLIFFVYGLAFFLMGFSILLQTRRRTTFRLGRYLPVLAAFGLLHGCAEWGYIFLSPSLAVEGWETLRGTVLNGGHAVLITVSFAFLFAFGGSLLANTWGCRNWIKWITLVEATVWVVVFFWQRPHDPNQLKQWLAIFEAIARYLLAFPGALMSSWGLYLQRGEVRKLGHPPLERSLLGASLAFALYGFAGGLVVPPAPFFPAQFLNTTLLLKIGLPVQLLRAIAGVLVAYFVIHSLDLYEVEAENRLRAFRQQELVWLERERIRRDLHDGAIQSVYGLALGLEQALALINHNSAGAAEKLMELRNQADKVIGDLRRTLDELYSQPELPETPVAIIEDLLAGFTAATDLIPTFRYQGFEHQSMTWEQRNHLHYMVAEILSNIKRHALATEVEVSLGLEGEGLNLSISDNGQGFDPEKVSPGHGLANLQERAMLAGGWIEINSQHQLGTRVTLWLPYQPPEGGKEQ